MPTQFFATDLVRVREGKQAGTVAADVHRQVQPATEREQPGDGVVRRGVAGQERRVELEPRSTVLIDQGGHDVAHLDGVLADHFRDLFVLYAGFGAAGRDEPD